VVSIVLPAAALSDTVQALVVDISKQSTALASISPAALANSRCGMIDRNAIADAVHEIYIMVEACWAPKKACRYPRPTPACLRYPAPTAK
jgi:hypothetical protein